MSVKSKLFFCTDCGWKYMNKQMYIHHWKVKPGLAREPTEEEIFDYENTVTVTIETRDETMTEGTRNKNNNDSKPGTETFEDLTIDLDSFELVEDLTGDNDDDIQTVDVIEVPETSDETAMEDTRNGNSNNRKQCMDTFEDSAPTTIDVDLFELVEDVTVDNADDDIQIEDVQEVPETSMVMPQQQTMDDVSGPESRMDTKALWDEASSHTSKEKVTKQPQDCSDTDGDDEEPEKVQELEEIMDMILDEADSESEPCTPVVVEPQSCNSTKLNELEIELETDTAADLDNLNLDLNLSPYSPPQEVDSSTNPSAHGPWLVYPKQQNTGTKYQNDRLENRLEPLEVNVQDNDIELSGFKEDGKEFLDDNDQDAITTCLLYTSDAADE